MTSQKSSELTLKEIIPNTGFPDGDPRKELIERVLRNRPKLNDADTNEVLVIKAIESIKKITLTDADFDDIKKKTFALSSIIFDEYAKLLVKEIHDSDTDEIVIASFGSGIRGNIEKILQEKINSELVGSKKRIRFVGLDTYTPDDFFNSFFAGGNFYKLEQNDRRNFADIIGVENDEKLIVIANYVLHHQESRIPAFKLRCDGASAIVLDEPVDRERWRNVDYRFVVIAYDLLANMAINPEWAKIFMENPEAFFVDYLFIDELEIFGKKIIYFETCPLLSLAKI